MSKKQRAPSVVSSNMKKIKHEKREGVGFDFGTVSENRKLEIEK